MKFSPADRLLAILTSPVRRLDEIPVWGGITATAAAMWQLAVDDLFASSLVIVLVAGVADYCVGVKAARHANRYDARAAHAGAMGKMSGLILLFLLRLLEWWASSHELVTTNGAIATAVAVSLICVDLQSIATHRESFGARPIPVLSQVLNWLQQLALSRIPGFNAQPVPPAVPKDAQR